MSELQELVKSHIKQYTRREKSGAVTVVHEHEDKRTKQPDKPATGKRAKKQQKPIEAGTVEPQTDVIQVDKFIPVFRMAYLQNMVDETNKRCKKLGCAPIEFTRTGERKMVEYEVPNYGPYGHDDEYHKEDVECERVQLRGEAPRLNGWKVLGVIRHEPGGNIVNRVGGTEDMAKKWRKAKPYCEHCNSLRQRNSTYIVQKGKEVKQVGKTCLKDFTGSHKSPEKMADAAELLGSWLGKLKDDDEDFWSMGGHHDQPISVKQMLEYSVDDIKKHGFVSRKMVQEGRADGSTTSDYVMVRLFSKNEEDHKIDEESKKEAAKVYKWYTKDLAKKPGKSDFEHNLSVYAKQGFVLASKTGKALPFIAAVYPAYLREMGQLAEKKAAGTKQASEHVGSIGERYGFHLTLDSMNEISGNYGITHLYKYHDKNGNKFSYFSSKPLHGSDDIGKEFDMAASVKDHKEFKGSKETVLTRGTLGGKAPSADGAKASRENLEKLNDMFNYTPENKKLAKRLAKNFESQQWVKDARKVPENEAGMGMQALTWAGSLHGNQDKAGQSEDSIERLNWASRHIDHLMYGGNIRGDDEAGQLRDVLYHMNPEQVLGLTATLAGKLETKEHEAKYTGVKTTYLAMPNWKAPTRYGTNGPANRPYVTAVLRLAQKIAGLKKSSPQPGVYLIKSIIQK